MLAVVVASFVLLAVNGIFFGALRLRNNVTRAFEESLPVQRTLGILQRDLANLVPPGGSLGGALQTVGTNLAVLGQVGPQFHTATALLEDALPWAEVQQVTYLLLDATNRTRPGLALMRSVSRNLLPPGYNEPLQERLLEGVETLEFLFHDGTDWRADWDSTTEETPLPRAIKVELQLAARDERSEPPPPIELVVPLLVDGATNATATASADTASTGGDAP